MKSRAKWQRDDTLNQINTDMNKRIFETWIIIFNLGYLLPVGAMLLVVYNSIDPEGRNSAFFLKMTLIIPYLIGAIIWIIKSFKSVKLEKDEKVFFQLTISGQYKEWGKNVRPSSIGLCMLHPFTLDESLFRVEWIKIPDKKTLVQNKTSLGEDGEIFDLESGGVKTPLVIKYQGNIRISDTFLYTSQDTSRIEQIVHGIFFKNILEGLNIHATSNEVSREDVKRIRDFAFEKIEEALTRCGLILDQDFQINSIEKTTAEQEAQRAARVLAENTRAQNNASVEKAKADAKADKLRAKQLNDAQKLIKSSHPGLDDREVATLVLSASGAETKVNFFAGRSPTLLGISGGEIQENGENQTPPQQAP